MPVGERWPAPQQRATVKAVAKLFSEIAPRSGSRNGGYTRIVKLGPRASDSALMAFIEWSIYRPRTEN